MTGDVELPIAAWSAWAPGIESVEDWKAWAAGQIQPQEKGSPALAFVDPLLRRRLSRASRMAIHAAWTCLGDRPATRTVFASRHGELQRTVGMLRDLAHGQELSPTEFALSVHNAAAGVHSISRADRSPSVSVVAGEESFTYGLLEAAMQWRADPARPVLFVYSEEPIPNEYRSFVQGEEYPHALALLLSAEPETTVHMTRVAASSQDRARQMQSLVFLRAWIRKEPEASWQGERSTWHWRLNRPAS